MKLVETGKFEKKKILKYFGIKLFNLKRHFIFACFQPMGSHAVELSAVKHTERRQNSAEITARSGQSPLSLQFLSTQSR